MKSRSPRKSLCLLAFIVFGIFTAASAQPPQMGPPAMALYRAPKASDLVEFNDPRGVLKAVFPGKPASKTTETDRAEINIASVTINAATSMVTVFDFKEVPTASDDVMLGFIRAYVGDNGTKKVIAERTVERDGRKTWEFDAEGGLEFKRARAIRDGYRIFVMHTTATNWGQLKSSFPARVAEFEKETARFFDSFVLLDPYVPEKPLTVALYGIVEQKRYVNKFLGFTLDLPEGRYVLPSEEVEMYTETGKTIFESKDAERNRFLDEQRKKEFVLLAVSNGTAENSSGSNLVVTTLRARRGVKDPVEFAGPTRRLLFDNPNFSNVSVPRAVEVAGRRFAVITFDGRLGVVETKHRLFFTIKDGFVITFFQTARDKKDEMVLTKFFESVKFDQK